MPQQDEPSPYLTMALTGAVLGTIAYRRPKAFGMFAGMCALMTAPYLGFMVVTVNRFSRVRDGAWGGLGCPGRMLIVVTLPPNAACVTCFASLCFFVLQFASKLVATVDTMDATGSSGFEGNGWGAEGGGGDEWQ